MIAAVVLLILILINGFFSMCEIALVSSRRARLTQEAKNGRKGAMVALRLLDEPEKFLSTIQIGITLAGVFAGAYGADAYAGDLQPLLEKSNLLRPVAGQLAFSTIIIVVTYFTLIIGELVPKAIAFRDPERISMMFAPVMRLLTKLAYPLVVFLSTSTTIFQRLLLIKPGKKKPITEDELKYYIDTGARHGSIPLEEGKMLHRVFRFGDQTARSLMIFRKNIGWLNAQQPADRILKDILLLPYTKYPVCEGTLDEIIGTVTITDVLQHVSEPDFNIRQYLKPALFLPSHTPAQRILELFRIKKVHIGFVTDGSQSIVGLLTVHDLLENIVGDLPDYQEEVRPRMRLRADGSWLADGRISLREVFERLGIDPVENEVSGSLEDFLIKKMTGPVKISSSASVYQYSFEIMDTDGDRIDKVLITKADENEG